MTKLEIATFDHIVRETSDIGKHAHARGGGGGAGPDRATGGGA